MKIIFSIPFLLCFVLSTQAQDRIAKVENSKSYAIIRSSLGSGGSSNKVITNNGAYSVSQSIGQSSVIGTHSKNGYYLRQGYQQPLHKIKVVNTSKINDLDAKIFPNPFQEAVSIAFSETIKNDISVSVFDVNGKLVHSQEFPKSQHVQLNLDKLSTGNYILKAISNGKLFNAKLIKI